MKLPKASGNPEFRISRFTAILNSAGLYRASVTLEERDHVLQWVEVIAHIRLAQQRRTHFALTNLVINALEKLHQNYMATTRGLKA